MKKMTTIGMMVFMLSMSIPAMGAMSISKVRENARFLTDRMTYELGLTMMQYDDIYEVNYDFINNIRYIMDDVVRGYGYAVDRYYEYLDYRNDDLRWILSDRQYRRFMQTEYFYRPVYTTKTNWLFRIFKVYTDVKHFYYGKPKHYKSYKGEHFRSHHNQISFYKTNRKEHYNHPVYKGETKVQRKPAAKPIAKPAVKPADNRRKEQVKKTDTKVQRKVTITDKKSQQKVQSTEKKQDGAKINSRNTQKRTSTTVTRSTGHRSLANSSQTRTNRNIR